MIALCAAAVVFVLLSFLSAFESRALVPALSTGPGGEAVSDTYMFVHRTLVGDGTLTARVTSLSGAHTSLPNTSGNAFSQSSKRGPNSRRDPGLAPLAKAGIILEPDTNQGTAYAAVMVTGSHGVRMQYNYTHDSPGIAGAAGPSSPRWLRLTGEFTISGSGDIAPLVDDIISAQWAGASIVNGTIAALLFVIVLATVFATSEYRRGLIRTTFAASPRRGRVLAAKAVVAGSLAFAAGATATAIAEAITRHVLAANGSYLFPQSWPDLARVIIGTGLLLGLTAALAVALGIMLRRSATAVAAGIVLLVLPGILGSQSGNWLMRFTPTAAFAIQATLPRSSLVTSDYTPPNGYFPVSPWAGLAVLAAYTTVALAAATWLLRRRDP